jgi:lipopolysaccharide transport system permease protein
LFAPLGLLAIAPLALGLAWFLAAIGVYFRDVGQIVPPLLTALMFLSPVLYPREAIPEDMRKFIVLNPLTVPVEAFRDTVIFGTLPDFLALAVYAAVACIVAGLGLFFFNQTRRGFADVL